MFTHKHSEHFQPDQDVSGDGHYLRHDLHLVMTDFIMTFEPNGDVRCPELSIYTRRYSRLSFVVEVKFHTCLTFGGLTLYTVASMSWGLLSVKAMFAQSCLMYVSHLTIPA